MHNINILLLILTLAIHLSFVFSEVRYCNFENCWIPFNNNDSIMKTYPNKIQIINKKVEGFQKDSFKNILYSSIKTLQLNLSSVKLHIEPFTFSHLQQLEKLEIYSASVLLYPSIFHGLNNLANLKIQIANETTHDLNEILNRHLNLHKLELLNHYNADICRINNDHLNILQLQYTGGHMETLTNKSFICLKNLQHLTITETNLTSIIPGAFDGLKKLNTLTLVSNKKLTYIPSNVFNIQSLNIIDLSKNSISKIDNGALTIENKKLSLLNMSYNSLRMIQEKTFQTIQCSLLDLTQNRLMYVDNRAFNSSDIDEIYFFKNEFLDQINISKWGINSNTTLVFMDYKKYDSTFGPHNNKQFIISKKPYICYLSEYNYFKICKTQTNKLYFVGSLVADNYETKTFIIIDDISLIEHNTFNDLKITTLIIQSTEMNLILNKNSFAGLPNLQVLKLKTKSTQFNNFILDNVKSTLKTLEISTTENTEKCNVFVCQLVNRLELENLQIVNTEKVSICDVDKCKGIKLNILRLSYTFGSFINLQPADFFCLKKLQYLGITNSSLENIESGAFDKLDNVKILILSSNELTHINRDIFKELISLNTLILSHNKINSIDDRAFESKTLSMLDLSFNELTSISQHTFFGVESKELDLSYNKLKSIDNYAFKNIYLDKIYIHNNNELKENEIKLYLDDSKIQTNCVYQNMWKICKKLNSLSSVNIIIHHFSPEFPLPSSTLELSGISSIRKYTFQNSNVRAYFKSLIINNSGDEFIIYPESFEGLIQLEDLELNVGPVKLQNHLFDKLISLQYLKIQIIENVHLSQVLENLNNLKTLEIIKNSNVNICENSHSKNIPNSIIDIRWTSGSIRDLKKNSLNCISQIENFKITNTQLMNIETGTFDLLNNLKYINLSFNKIISISMNLFKGLKNLSVLLLNNNEIKDIDSNSFVISRIENINLLNLSYNKIDTIKTNTFNGFKFDRLDLSYNEIKRIENDVFKDTNVKDLYLHNNSGIIVSSPAWSIPIFTFVYIDNEYDTEIYCRILETQKNTTCVECRILCGSYFMASRG